MRRHATSSSPATWTTAVGGAPLASSITRCLALLPQPLAATPSRTGTVRCGRSPADRSPRSPSGRWRAGSHRR
eukprot:8746614-Alexandrium_andersonii.AAC.1